MFFYEDLVKKIENSNFELKKDKYKFGLNMRYRISKLGVGIPLILIGLYFAYGLVATGVSISSFLGILILFSGIMTVNSILKYKMEINISENKIENQSMEFKIDSVETVELKKMIAPGTKRIEACISVITNEKKNYIIPLIMNKKMEFCNILKSVFKEKFIIIKE